jgi:hypothetical protein
MKKNWADQSYENGWNKKTRPPRKVPGWTKCYSTKNPLTMAKVWKKLFKFIFLIK